MNSYLTLSRVSDGSPVLQFSILASLAFKLPSMIFFSCCWIVLLIECQLFLFACCREFIFFFLPFVSLLCYLYPSMVVFYVTAVRCFCFWFEKVVYFVFPSFPQSLHCSACLDFGTKSWVPFSSFPYPSFFGGDAILIANRQFILLCISIEHGILAPLIQSLCLSLLQKRRRYLGRNRCQCCFLLVFRFRSSLGFLFFLNVPF